MLRRSLLVVAAVAVLAGAADASAALPRRIVSLSPTATESLFAIGAGRQVIAVDERVAEDALVGGSRGREHPADERGEHHPRRP